MTKNKNYYVDNVKFSEHLAEYAKQYREALAQDKEPPMMSDYIGSCVLNIAKKLSSSPNFANYSFREDMINDGIENVLLYVKNFDAEKMIAKGKKPNAFAYVTQIIYYAFLRRIEKEKKQQKIKEAVLLNSDMFFEFDSMSGFDDNVHAAAFMEMMQHSMKFNHDATPENPDMKPRKKRRPLYQTEGETE